ncbi:DNA polymerase [Dechloromonas sp. H13]|uniref:DNA polymerase n=1 Tax=Dechloromonas sp. H13 TaxID=2570193 RepID=UPI001D189D2B|nr:DNA polymerase [Dechloromonas sp. H13]
MGMPHFPGGIWLVDFEFHPAAGREGNPPVPVCMVARELTTGRTLRLWQDEMARLGGAPFPTDESALFVAYYASAEMGCFLALGWPFPKNVLDLFIAFRRHTNGKRVPAGNGLLGALAYFGLDALAADEKDAMRDLVLQGGPWNATEQRAILDYCESDVVALAKLLPVMRDEIDWPRATLHGRYTSAMAHMEHNGVPIDTEALAALKTGWHGIQQNLIAAVDADFGVYDGTTFKLERFERYLATTGIAWPSLTSGGLDLRDNTFKDMARAHPQLSPLRELRSALSQMRLSDLTVGDDGRNRCMLSMYRSKTGRNQPSNTRFIFGPSVWLRGLIRPADGYGLAYVDWSQQEFGIAAALSGDLAMMAAYDSGDPYLAFAIQAGAVPPNATKHSHKAERDQFKQCVLAVQYGMGAESLAYRINQPVARARELLELHRRTYRRFWVWSDGILHEALLGGRVFTTYGWQLFIDDTPNGRSLCNFPMQANGAEMLRLACCRLVADGVRVCAPVHDAILIEARLADLDAVVAHTQAVMRAASAAVLGGFELSSDAKIVRSPERYMDGRGVMMWNTVMEQLALHDRKVAHE